VFSFLLSSGTSSESFFFQRGHLYLHKMKFRGKLAHAAKINFLARKSAGKILRLFDFTDDGGYLVLDSRAAGLGGLCRSP